MWVPDPTLEWVAATVLSDNGESNVVVQTEEENQVCISLDQYTHKMQYVNLTSGD